MAVNSEFRFQIIKLFQDLNNLHIDNTAALPGTGSINACKLINLLFSSEETKLGQSPFLDSDFLLIARH